MHLVLHALLFPPIQLLRIKVDIPQQTSVVRNTNQDIGAGVELLHRGEAVHCFLGDLIHARIGF